MSSKGFANTFYKQNPKLNMKAALDFKLGIFSLLGFYLYSFISSLT